MYKKSSGALNPGSGRAAYEGPEQTLLKGPQTPSVCLFPQETLLGASLAGHGPDTRRPQLALLGIPCPVPVDSRQPL